MTSLIFRALDRHIVDGRADRLAIDDGTVALTYAQLLAQTAAFAGGLANVGAGAGTLISIDARGAARVGVVLACARLGAIPAAAITGARADLRIVGDPPVVHAGEHEYAWATILGAGKTDPIPAPDRDAPGYAEMLMDGYEEIFATLTAGATLT